MDQSLNLNTQIDQVGLDAYAGMDIPWLLKRWADATPDKPFVIWEPFEGEAETWTFARLRGDARRLAAGLHHKGVRAGDFVIIHMNNSPEFIVSWFACAELGAVAVSTNTRSVARDLSYFADHTSAVCVLTQPEFATMIASACPDVSFMAVTGAPSPNTLSPDARRPDESFVDLFVATEAAADEALPERPVDAQANLSVQFTSGTTSRPKAVLWTHANGIFAGRISAVHMRLRQDDRTLVFMPLFHTNAQGYSMLASLWVGATIVVQSRFSASRFWSLSLKHRLTWLSTIPFVWKAIADQPVPDHDYRFWGSPARLPAIEEAFGVRTIGWWGMTETLTHGIVTDYDHPGPARTIGRCAPEFEIQVRNRDGSPTPFGERGLLYIRGVRGVSLFKEYYRNPEANASAFDDDGWFDTGDIVRIDDEGWLYFSDRDKDMLKVGAENVAASEIETVVLMTGMADEVAVIGRPDKMLDEVPVAFVIPTDAGRKAEAADPGSVAESIISFCTDNLADFKVPRDVILVDEMPRSTLNKVAKNELRSRLLAAESTGLE